MEELLTLCEYQKPPVVNSELLELPDTKPPGKKLKLVSLVPGPELWYPELFHKLLALLKLADAFVGNWLVKVVMSS